MAPPPLDRLGRSPLHYAAAEGASESVAKLIGAGADVSLPDRAGWTPLHFAAQSGGAPTIRLLISAGASIDSRDEHGNTPLWRAVFNFRGDSGSIDALKAAGADEYAENADGVSPHSLARSIANYGVARLFP
ncbi:ankyrin repeat domain-containing protein [Phenylobacterium terrae]|uniref:Ankyrin repeat domain-containing protein n=1 Tax=Phenylobacterium terrae TaxID=2665495 RepID=A0ABW4N899_9CAUL